MKNLILRNSFFMALFNLFGRASGFIRYMLLVGFLSGSHFSLVTYAFGFGKIGRHFMDGGLDNLVSRDGARDCDRVPAFYVNAMMMKFILAIVFFSGTFIYLFYIRQIAWTEIVIVYLALIGSAMTSFTGVIRSCFTAIERMEFIFYTNMPSRIVSITMLFLFLWLAAPIESSVAVIEHMEFVFHTSIPFHLATNSLLYLSLILTVPLGLCVGAVSFENFLWFVLLGNISRRFFKFSVSLLSWQTIKYMLSESWSLALYGFFNVFYLSLDVLMIEYIMGSIDYVGPYTIASLLVEGVSLLVSSYFIAVYPSLSRLYVSDFAAYRQLFRRSFIALFMFTIPVSILMGFWADVWMNIIKDTGEISTWVLQILSVNLNLSMLNTLLIIVFTSCNRQRLLVVFTALAVGISFLSNWLLIEYYAQPGAAVASLLSQVVLLIIMGITAKRLFQLPFPWQKPLSLAAACIASALIAKTVPMVPPLAEPVLFAVILAISVYSFGIFTPDEIRRLYRTFRQ